MPIKFTDEPQPQGSGGIRFLDEPQDAALPVQSNEPQQITPEQYVPTSQADRMMRESETQKIATGRGMMDVYQGTKQLALNMFGEKEEAEAYGKEISEEIEAYNKGNPGFQASRLIGSLATPLGLIPGVAGVASLPIKMAAGAGLGATAAATAPVTTGDYWVEKGKQAGIGATIGGIIPGAIAAAKPAIHWIDELTKPLYEKGRVRDVAKFLNEYVSENKPMITKAINKAIDRGDKRPVGQIIAEAAMEQGDDFGGILVRLEKDLARESDAIKSIYAKQSVGRRAVIDQIAGTEDDLAAAVAQRSATGAKNYAEAFKVNVQADDDLIKLMDNKFANKAVKDALDIAKVDGAKSHSQILHNVKIGLDKQLAKAGDDALSMAEKKAVESVKKKLVGWLEDKNPQYRLAREQYAVDSKPINKMLVGQEVKNSLVTSLEKESPSKFAEGLRNAPRTIKRATGDSRFQKLDDILDTDEVTALNAIKKELAVEAKAKTMAAGSKAIKGLITGEVSLSLPHILSRPVVITNHLLKVLGKDKTPEYKAILVGMMKDATKFAKIYGGPSSSKKTQAAMDIVKKLNIIAGSQQAAQESGKE